MAIELEAVLLDKPADVNIIVGQSHPARYGVNVSCRR